DQILLERAAAGRGQAVLRARNASLEHLVARDVLRVLELARMDAEIAVGRLQQPLQVVERQPLVHRQRTDDAETKTLVNEPIELERAALDFRLQTSDFRSEERRVGKECRARWAR